MTKLLPFIVTTLKNANLKYEVHTFDSGAIMVDIWINNRFYVIQIEDDTLGLSENTEETTPFDIIPDHSFKEANAFLHAFSNILPKSDSRKTLIINGSNFSTLEGFYDEVDKVLTRNLDWKTGHNLNAFNDLLRGGFEVHEYEEPITLIWLNSEKSKADLNTLQEGESIYQILTNIIREHEHIEFLEY